jgi:hypothetical protein
MKRRRGRRRERPKMRQKREKRIKRERMKKFFLFTGEEEEYRRVEKIR